VDLFVDPFLLTLSLVCTIVLLLINIYFLAHYSHHADGGFGSSSATKFIIVSNFFASFYNLTNFFQILAFLIAECQVLVLALDVINSREGSNIDMFVFWQIIYMSSLFMMVIILPFSYFFYETSEDEAYVSIFVKLFFSDPNFNNKIHQLFFHFCIER
jgi:hypothetical protein